MALVKKTVLFLLVAVALQSLWSNLPFREQLGLQPSGSDSLLAQAFEDRQSDLQVRGTGQVLKVLPDDNEGSRHQRFLLTLESGQTLLVAHNIDLAPKVSSLAAGDTVEFFGEYEWNPRGGVIHWTHRDPGNRHVSGWLKHQGRTYE